MRSVIADFGSRKAVGPDGLLLAACRRRVLGHTHAIWDDRKRRRRSVTIAKHPIPYQVDATCEQGRELRHLFTSLSDRKRSAIGVRRMNIYGISTAVARRDGCKQLVLAPVVGELDLGASERLQQHRQVASSIAPTQVPETFPVKMLVRQIAPSLTCPVDPVGPASRQRRE
jgi:hypothetical protein